MNASRRVSLLHIINNADRRTSPRRYVEGILYETYQTHCTRIGFKSYPVRTQITGWDPSFNAITGLNGSGKSNILDAICFVLGITNMTSVNSLVLYIFLSTYISIQMRAQNQQDLIYKRGQAGVTKASVTIVFDNSDRSTSPVGLENCKQITVTRQVSLIFLTLVPNLDFVPVDCYTQHL